MVKDGLDFEIPNILECREDEEFEVLQRLSAYCQDIYNQIATSREAYRIKKKEYEQKEETINEDMLRLHRAMKDTIVERDNIGLQQKVTDKKMALAAEQKAKLEEDTKDILLKKENICLELVELTRATEESRKQKKDRWNAIKLACTYYKENLNIHISVDPSEEHDKVKLTFFQMKNPDRDNYYVILEKSKSNWTVGEIEPALEEKHLETIKATVDFTKPLGTPDIMVFLCTLRTIFLKYYVSRNETAG